MLSGNTVHKTAVPIANEGEPTEIELPRIADIRFVGIQPGNEQFISIWYERPMKEVFCTPYEKRYFQTYGTGHPIPMDATHIGSVIDGRFVWHLYERHIVVPGTIWNGGGEG